MKKSSTVQAGCISYLTSPNRDTASWVDHSPAANLAAMQHANHPTHAVNAPDDIPDDISDDILSTMTSPMGLIIGGTTLALGSAAGVYAWNRNRKKKKKKKKSSEQDGGGN